MPHAVRGLIWAERGTSPWPKVRGRKGTKALGLKYERLVGMRLGLALGSQGVALEHNPWFHFQDTSHRGFCSPDLLLVQAKTALVVEVKLTDWRLAWQTLHTLYLPVLELALGVQILPLVVVKHVSPGAVIATSLREALMRRAEQPVLHWLGHGGFPMI